MSNLRQAAQQTLEALERYQVKRQDFDRFADEIPALRTALEQQAEPVHGDIRALKYRIHELEGEVIGYKRMLDVAEAAPQQQAEPVPDTLGHVGFQEWWDSVADDYEVNDFKKMRRAWNAAVKYEAPPQRRPLTDEMHKQMKEASDNMEMRGAFANGWLSAEAAHNIKDQP